MSEENGAQAAPYNIFNRALALNLEIGRFGTRKKVRSSAVQTDADHTMLHISKDILDADEFKALARFDSETRNYIWRKSLPSQFRNGIQLIPFEDVTPVDEYLTQRVSERDALIEKAIARLDPIKKDAEARLGSLFNDRDYPSDQKIRNCYSMTWNFVEFGTPGKLKSLNARLFERMFAQEKQRAVNEVDQIRLMLRAGMAEIVEHMVDRLTPEADGKKKVFRDSMVDNVKEFLSDFEHKNIIDDAELAALVRQANEIMDGVTAKDLRTDEGFRDFTREQFSNMKGVLDAMMKDAPSRKFHLRAEDTGDPTTEDLTA